MPSATNIGAVIRRLRERWRLTQQDVVEYARLERSASYISSIETGKTSPTLAELEAMAIVFRTNVIDLIREAQGEEPAAPAPETSFAHILELLRALDPPGQALAEELLKVLVAHQGRNR
ncbi:MAG: helix-turn-helix transcriptional regulator [Armatimonadetes bacterium]|jgi:transcriptional regulator with XRE-family HTH domain|nr:helix-turn-helix transcriptional regulator [Armatimonadota bacterium]